MKKFYLETNQIFSWINNEDQLLVALSILHKYNYSLDKIVNIENGSTNFGTRREHKGSLKLLDWLNKTSSININKLLLDVEGLSKKLTSLELSELFAAY